jgi:hypothetical protein
VVKSLYNYIIELIGIKPYRSYSEILDNSVIPR